jgi:hypothetical protein
MNIDLQSPGNEYSSPPPEIGLFTTALPARFKVAPKIVFQIFHLLQGRLNSFLSGGMPKILKSS